MTQDPPNVRPTRLCLEQLGYAIPTAIPDTGTPLHTIDHPLVQRAQMLPEESRASALERVLALTDRVWFKVKTGRWRGAGTRLSDAELPDGSSSPDSPGRWWLGAGGRRQAGSPDDFYEEVEAKALREGKGTGAASSAWLLPTEWDWRRLHAESAVAWAVYLRTTVRRIIATSIRSGESVDAAFGAYMIQAVVHGAGTEGAYLAVTAERAYDPKVIAAILSAVPGVAAEDWQAEPGGVAGITPHPGQIIWSTLLPPEAVTEVLRLVEEADH